MPMRLFRIRTVVLSLRESSSSSGVAMFRRGDLPAHAAPDRRRRLGEQCRPPRRAAHVRRSTSSVLAGQLISRTGRYRIFPIVGTGTATVGMFLLSTLDAGSSRLESSVYMAILGVGPGMVMPVMVLATQNAAPIEDLGVATSTIGFFRRAFGGSVGVAAFGASVHRAHHRPPRRQGEPPHHARCRAPPPPGGPSRPRGRVRRTPSPACSGSPSRCSSSRSCSRSSSGSSPADRVGRGAPCRRGPRTRLRGGHAHRRVGDPTLPVESVADVPSADVSSAGVTGVEKGRSP